jgi:hypothetical protein
MEFQLKHLKGKSTAESDIFNLDSGIGEGFNNGKIQEASNDRSRLVLHLKIKQREQINPSFIVA